MRLEVVPALSDAPWRAFRPPPPYRSGMEGPGRALTRRRLLQFGAMGGLALIGEAIGANWESLAVSGQALACNGPEPPSGICPDAAARSGAAVVPGAGPSLTFDPPSPADWYKLAGQLAGRLVLPSNPAYAVDLQLFDPQYDSVRPAGLAYCNTATDVARCIVFARAHGLPVAARSGGHSYAGYSTTNGLVIDLSPMSYVARQGKMATVGAGARLIDVYSGLAQEGVSIPAGSCPTVGIAGLTLGGGIGVMDRLHGLTCDHIVELEVVTAAGEKVRASAGTNSDLFWACRGGGGGNFGVATAFQFSTFPVTDVSLFAASWPWQAAADLLPAWFQWVASSPDPLWSNCLLESIPGTPMPTVRVGGVWAGSPADASAQLRALIRVVGGPVSQAIGEKGFEDAMYIEAGCSSLSQAACHLAGKFPGGTLPRVLRLLKSDILNQPLAARGVEAVLAGIEQRHQEGGQGEVLFDSWGGAINRVAPDATAFVHRKALASAQYEAEFSAGVGAAAVRAGRNWMDNWYASLRPFVSGEAYQNYIDASLPNWEHAYYGANLARLEKVKTKWDPDNFFQFGQSIPLRSVRRLTSRHRLGRFVAGPESGRG